MTAFCQRRVLACLLAGLALAPLAAQEPAPEAPGASAAAPENAAQQDADPAEVAALAELRALEESLPAAPSTPTEAALQDWAEQQRVAYRGFLLAHPGRLAAAEAWHALGRLRLQFDRDPAAGLEAMRNAWILLRDFSGVPPDGMRLSREGYGEALLARLLDVDALERAQSLLEELRAHAPVGGVRAARLEAEARRLAVLHRLRPGQVFPDFRAMPLEGGAAIGPAQLRGAPLLIDFQAAWCGPCRSALPRRVAQAADWMPRGLGILAVFLDDDAEDARVLVEAYAPSWPQTWLEGGLDGDAARALALRSLPRRFLLDAEGVIVARDLEGAALERAVEALLGPPTAED